MIGSWDFSCSKHESKLIADAMPAQFVKDDN